MNGEDPTKHDRLKLAGRRIVGWRLTASRLHRWAERRGETGEGREELADARIVAAWPVEDVSVLALPLVDRPGDTRSLRCLVDPSGPDSSGAYSIDLLDLIPEDLGAGAPLRRDPLHIGSLKVESLWIDLPSWVADAMYSVAQEESAKIQGRTLSGVDFELQPPSRP